MRADAFELAACRGSGLDFHDAASSVECKLVCEPCPCRKVCLDYALDFERGNDARRWGVWGGLDPLERIAEQERRDTVRRRK